MSDRLTDAAVRAMFEKYQQVFGTGPTVKELASRFGITQRQAAEVHRRFSK